MPTEVRPKRTARPPRERLASLKHPRPRPIRDPQRAPPAAVIRCPNPECATPDVQDVDGTKVCVSCGTVVEDSNIVSEITFGESSSGAAVVQGGFVGEGQRHARSLGPAFRRAGGLESREVTENQGRDELRKQANALNLPDSIFDAAFTIYKLAATNNFIQGRRVRMVAAVCLYVACRREPNQQTLLMDFSELLQVNVFRLGQTYQDLKKDLWLHSYERSGMRPVIEVEDLIMKYARKLEFGSSLMKVADDAAKIVKRMKRDWMVTGRRPSGLCGACIILAARMNNFRRTVREVVYVVKVADITVGKRLEEFKRTASSEMTVSQFREHGLRLKKQHDPPAIYEAEMKEKKRLKKLEKIRARNGSLQSPTNIDDTPTPATSRQSSVNPPQELRRDSQGFAIPQRPVIDPMLESHSSGSPKDGEATAGSPDTTPDANAHESSRSTGSTHRKRRSSDTDEPTTKRKKKDRPPPPVITEADLVAEAELQNEMERIMNDPESIAKMEDVKFQAYATKAKQTAEQQMAAERRSKQEARAAIRQEPIESDGDDDDEDDIRRPRHLSAHRTVETTDRGRSTSNGDAADASAPADAEQQPTDTNGETSGNATTVHNRWDIPSDPEISPSEFDDDPEVAHCLLTEAESRIKETIWVKHNEDWLRTQQAKHLRKELEEAHNAAHPEARKEKKKRRRGRLGDGSVLEGDTPVESAADATRRMLERRGKGFSKHINYERLDELYLSMKTKLAKSNMGGTTTSSRTETESIADTEAPSEAESAAANDTADLELGEPSRAGTIASAVRAAASALPTPPQTQHPVSNPNDLLEQMQATAGRDRHEPGNVAADDVAATEAGEDADAEEDDDELDVLADQFDEPAQYQSDEEVGFDDEDDEIEG